MKKQKKVVYYNFDKKIIHEALIMEDELNLQEIFPSNYATDEFIYIFIKWNYILKETEDVIEAYPIYNKTMNYLIFDENFNISGVVENNPSFIIIPEYYLKDGKSFVITTINDQAFINKRNISLFYVPKTIMEIKLNAFVEYSFFVFICEHNTQPICFQDGFVMPKNSLIKLKTYFGITKNNIKIINDVIYILKDNKVILTKYLSKEKDYIIPETLQFHNQTYDVTIIGDRAFSFSSIEQVTLPSTINIISDEAFRFAKELRQVQFDDDINLKEIRRYAFAGCSKLQDFYVPKTIEIMERYVFYHAYCCVVYLEDEIKENWNESWIADCVCYDHVKHDKLMDIDGFRYFILKDCAVLTCYFGNSQYVTIPNNIEVNGKIYDIKHIGMYAFSLTNIISVEIPKSVVTIEHGAFYNCFLLENIIFENDAMLNYIGSNAFNSCQSLKTITFPNKLEKIAGFAFSSCNNLETAFINSEAKVTNLSFSSTPKLVLYFLGEKKTLEQAQSKFGFFYDNENILLKKEKAMPIYDNANEYNTYITKSFIFVIKDNVAILTKHIGSEENVKTPSSIVFLNNEYKVTTIGSRAFMSDIIKTIYIPFSVLKIHKFAISDNKELKAIYCDTSNALEEWDDLWTDKKSIVQFNYQGHRSNM